MTDLPSHPLRLADLPARRESELHLAPDAAGRAALADALGVPAIRKLRLAGRLIPIGRSDWELRAELGATVVQDCIVTLEPVTTRIDEAVVRRYMAQMPDLPGGSEVEMPEDETAEPLPVVLDLWQVMAEALALALPPYPRAEGVDLGESVHAEQGVAPMTDEAARPFAGLAALRDRMGDGPDANDKDDGDEDSTG